MDELSAVESSGNQNSVEPANPIRPIPGENWRAKNGIATRIKPGQALNPNGRPKGVKTLARELRKAMSPELRQKYVDKLLAVACDPDHREYMNAVKLVWDRRDGPIVREMAITSGIPSVSFEVHLNAPGPRALPALPVANEQRVIDVTPNEPST